MAAIAETKVFLLGGQSNMAGLGGYAGNNPWFLTNPPIPPADKPCPSPYNMVQTNVKLWSDQTNNSWADLQPGYGFHFESTDKTFGPEVSFGYTLKQQFPNDDIYLVKLGVNGSDLAYSWNPDGSGGNYNLFKASVNAAVQDLTGAGESPIIAGMIWMQGEGDAQYPALASAYETNLTNLIEHVRSDFDAPDMRFVIGRIATYYDTKPTPGGNATVRAAQMAVAGAVPNTAWVDTDDLSWAYIGHYGTDGQIELGIRFANEFVQAPEPSSLVLAGTGLLVSAACLFRKQKLRRRLRRSATTSGVF
jgi:hypothetical protein